MRRVTKPVTAVLIGAGDRGLHVYGKYAQKFPDELKIVAVAEPIAIRREKCRKWHRITESHAFASWEDLFQLGKIADVAIITTPDQLHMQPTVQALELGYDVLLEKPMATTIEDCKTLVQKAEETEKILQICHVLRYTQFYSTIYSLIRKGKIGDIVNISMRENVSYYHYAHSYIRGNWHNRETSSPMILAKCCHDLDLLYWFVGAKAEKISSFGALTFFGPENAPEDAPEYCLDGCPHEKTCLFYAPRIYVDIVPLLRIAQKGGSFMERIISSLVLKYPALKKIPPFSKAKAYSGWPIHVITEDTSIEGRIKALKTGPYGKCVYKVEDHNVVDHQTVNIFFENEVTATLTMHGHSHEEGRSIRIDGTKGTITGRFLASGTKLVLYESLSGKKEVVLKTNMLDAHGGGDFALMKAFIKNVREQSKNGTMTSAKEALESHLMAFAADISRLEEKTVNLNELR